MQVLARRALGRLGFADVVDRRLECLVDHYSTEAVEALGPLMDSGARFFRATERLTVA